MTVNQPFEIESISNQLDSSQFLYSSERFLRDSNAHAETWQTKVFVVIIAFCIVALIIILSPIIFLFWLYAIYQTKRLRKRLELEREQILSKIRNTPLDQLREMEAKIAPYIDFLNELIDIRNTTEHSLVSKPLREDSMYLVVCLNEIMKEIRKTQTTDLIQKGISPQEIEDYNKRISSLRDLWDDEYLDTSIKTITNTSG